ncbi:MAG TPA: winged helix-turn-helix transcriptional regulator [Thermoplasmata archaeon]|nr:winged helix-turn-helix transcriptional regulator [Thermoplasmata archaeon]
MARFGEALRQVVSDRYADEEGVAGASPLMNGNRRRAFEYVAWHPCAAPAEVARALRVSGPTAAWHLAKLAEAGYVQESRQGRTRRYHAAGLGLEASEVRGMAAIAERNAAKVVALVLETPGLTATELTKKGAGSPASIRILTGVGFLSTVVDGRFRRYYPGPGLAAIERSAPKRLRAFRRQLMRRLAHDRLAPDARAAPGEVLEIDVRFGTERATLRVPTESLLAGHLG